MYRLRALNLAVCDDTAKTPITIISIHEIQSKFKKIWKPWYVCGGGWSTRIIVIELIKSTQFRYQETTASWNFFIFLIAITPPELSKGLRANRK